MGRYHPPRISSSLVQTTFTGACTAFATSTASTTNSEVGLPRRPNPPPSIVVRVQTCKPYRSCVVEALELSASPDVAAVGAQINKAVEWLHRRVRKIRNLVLGRDFGGRCL